MCKAGDNAGTTGKPSVKCPRCSAVMGPSEFGGVPVFECSVCDGTWIGAASAHRLFAGEKSPLDLVDALDAILDLDFDESRRHCPRCVEQRLKAVRIENTELDYCLACKGLYFDKGELQRVYPDTSGRDGKSASPEPITGGDKSLWQSLKRLLGGGN